MNAHRKEAAQNRRSEKQLSAPPALPDRLLDAPRSKEGRKEISTGKRTDERQP
jgi:hypothetical protein